MVCWLARPSSLLVVATAYVLVCNIDVNNSVVLGLCMAVCSCPCGWVQGHLHEKLAVFVSAYKGITEVAGPVCSC